MTATAEANATDIFMANVQKLMARRGISQSELARRCGVTPSRVCQLLGGPSSDLRLNTAHKIAAALGVHLATLVRE